MKLVYQVFCVGALCVLFSVSAYAGEAKGVLIENVRVDADGRGIAVFDTTLTLPATCADATHQRNLSFDTNTPGGKSILATLLTAQAAGKKIEAIGVDACNNYSNVESFKTIRVLSQ